MPVVIDGETYYKTAEVCRMVGISRSTFYRWLRQEPHLDASHRDKRGWRLYTAQEVESLRRDANQITPVGE